MPKFIICWTEAVNYSVTIEAETEDEAIAEWDGTHYDYSDCANDSAIIDDSVRIIDENMNEKEVEQW